MDNGVNMDERLVPNNVRIWKRLFITLAAVSISALVLLFIGMPHSYLTSVVRQSNYTRSKPVSDEYRYMRLTKNGGRLGNQLFQNAMLISTAHRYGYQYLVSERTLLRKYFIFREDKLKVLNKSKIFKEISTGIFTATIQELNTSYNWSFSGAFQSYKYHNETLLRSKLQFKAEVLDGPKRFVSSVRGPNTTLVSLQVRRGDFMKYEKRGFSVAPPSYIVKAMNFYRHNASFSNVTFIVMSNDMNWCKENVTGNDVMFSPFKSPGQDLALASLCDHAIITSGTFSWWTGWFSGGQVVYYKDYPIPGSGLSQRVNVSTYYPSHWIGMK